MADKLRLLKREWRPFRRIKENKRDEN